MNSKLSEKLRILLPSSGSLAEGSISFMAEKGINIEKESDRKLFGKIKDFPEIEIFFQRFLKLDFVTTKIRYFFKFKSFGGSL